MPNEAKQRFLGLSVDEISVVDKPAIEVEFLVTKRMEEIPMETQDQDATVTETTKNIGAEVVPVDAPASSEDAAVNKALENVAAMVENIAKAAGVKAPVEGETQETSKDASDEDTEKAKAPSATATSLRALYAKQLKAAGVKGDALTKAMDEFDKVAKPPAPPFEKTSKADDEADTTKADTDEDAQALKSMEALEMAINKAKSFTPGRVAQLKSVVEQLQKLLSGVMEVPSGTSPKTSTPAVGMHGNASAVQQLTKSVESLTETITKSNEATAAQHTELAGRVEAIEKARTPATALENETNDSIETKKGFWTGVL